MNTIMTNALSDFTNSVGKAYLSVIMALYMVAFEIMMHDYQYGKVSTKLYCVVFGLVALFVYLYRKQIGVDNKQYFNEMIEHHSMALLTSRRILEKTDDYNVAKLAKNIIEKQEEEIRVMRNTSVI